MLRGDQTQRIVYLKKKSFLLAEQKLVKKREKKQIKMLQAEDALKPHDN